MDYRTLSNLRKHFIENKNINRRKNRLLNESHFKDKNIISVDIQPEYEKYITFDLNEWVEFINENSNYNNIIFLYNGEDTLGMVSEQDYKYWLFELGMNEDVLDNAKFYDKGYAYFRYCMDNSIDIDNIVDLIKFMIKNDITDSRDINKDMWEKFMIETNHSKQDVRDLLENADDMINIPDLMDFLSEYSDIVLMGGGIDECLKEVEIALLSLDKTYNTIENFVY